MIPLLLCAGSLLQIFRLRLTDAARTEAQAHLNSALYAVESAYDGFHRAAGATWRGMTWSWRP